MRPKATLTCDGVGAEDLTNSYVCFGGKVERSKRHKDPTDCYIYGEYCEDPRG